MSSTPIETTENEYYGLTPHGWKRVGKKEYESLVKWIERRIAGQGASAKRVDVATGESYIVVQMDEPS